jgi:hypothetical protein
MLLLAAISVKAERQHQHNGSSKVGVLEYGCNSLGNQGDCRKLAKIAIRSKSPADRKAAVWALRNQDLLGEVAVQSKDPDTRSVAIRRLRNSSLLAKIAQEDEDASVRSAAAKRQAAGCGNESGCSSESELSKMDAPGVVRGFLLKNFVSLPRGSDGQIVPLLGGSWMKGLRAGTAMYFRNLELVDLEGYTFVSTELISDGSTIDSITVNRTDGRVLFHVGQRGTYHIRFADITRIRVKRHGAGYDLYLLNSNGATLDTISTPYFSSEILPALMALCPDVCELPGGLWGRRGCHMRRCVTVSKCLS